MQQIKLMFISRVLTFKVWDTPTPIKLIHDRMYELFLSLQELV